MDIIETITHPIRAIVHLKEDEDRAAATLTRLPLYKVVLPSDPQFYSPTGDYIRLNFENDSMGNPMNELHGWFKVESIVIDEVLEEYVEQEWVETANG